MAIHYRYTNSDSPMSSWGHAMFANNRERVEHYGNNCYIYDNSSGIHIEALRDIIIAQWQEMQETGRGTHLINGDDIYLLDINAAEIYESYNPTDIVDSANAWDNSSLLMWFYDRIAEPNNIMAVTTNDGAIVFDESLLQKQSILK